MKRIPLTQGKLALVDDEDYAFLMQWKWHHQKGYAKRTHYLGMSTKTGKAVKKTIAMQTAIVCSMRGFEVDHKDGNGLNNRRKNLRLATSSQQKMNTKKRRDNKSGIRGVSKFKRDGRWRAYINLKGKQKHLGFFIKKDDAKKAVKKAQKKYFGRFSR